MARAYTTNYQKRFYTIVEDHWGTVREFSLRMKINERTGRKYCQNPEKMTVAFIKDIGKKAGVDPLTIIQAIL